MTTAKQYEAQRLYLRDGKTLTGAAILLPRTDVQNYARGVILGLQLQLLTAALGDPIDEESDAAHWDGLLQVAMVAGGLARELTNPAHYGDNSPGLNTIRGVPVLPDPVFTHWDLLQYGYSVAGSPGGFHAACKLPPLTTFGEVVCAAGLLECDWAVRSLAEGRGEFATYLIGQALTCLQALDVAQKHGETETESMDMVQRLLQSHGRNGGIASAETRQTLNAEFVALAGATRQANGQLKGATLINKIAAVLGEKKWPGSKKSLPKSTVYAYLRQYDEQRR